MSAAGLSWIPSSGKSCQPCPRPLHYLDFETAAPAAPLYPGDHPYDLVPFQWSLHLEDDDLTHPNRLSHRSYLADGQSDPRLGFAKTLAESVQPQGAILTYTNYERQVLLALAGRLPVYAPSLVALAERCVDLCALVRRFLYHPRLRSVFQPEKRSCRPWLRTWLIDTWT